MSIKPFRIPTTYTTAAANITITHMTATSAVLVPPPLLKVKKSTWKPNQYDTVNIATVLFPSIFSQDAICAVMSLHPVILFYFFSAVLSTESVNENARVQLSSRCSARIVTTSSRNVFYVFIKIRDVDSREIESKKFQTCECSNIRLHCKQVRILFEEH